MRHNLLNPVAFDRVELHEKVGLPIIDSVPPASVTLRAGGGPLRNCVRVVVEGEARNKRGRVRRPERGIVHCVHSCSRHG